MEMLTPEYQKVIGPIFASSVAICLAAGTFMLQVLTKDATMIYYLSLTLSFLVMAITYFFIPESPKFLHASGQYEKCREVLS